MVRTQIDKLVDSYFNVEDYHFAQAFVHRVDVISSQIIYSILREEKPVSCLEIGASQGGCTCVILTALLRNKKKFKFVSSEMLDNYRELARLHTLQKCGQSPSMVGEIEKNLDQVPKKLDFAMIDTDHDLKNCLWYMENIVPRVKKGGLIMIHDWSAREKEGKIEYEGGSFPEIKYLIELYEKGELPFKKEFWTWDEPDWRESTVALSVWRKL